MFDRESIGELPIVQHRASVLRGVLLKQALLLIVLVSVSAVLTPNAWLASVPVATCLFGFVFICVFMWLYHKILGRKITEVVLRHGSELVGPHALPQVHEVLDEFSGAVGCERPRFFLMSATIEDMSPAMAWRCGGRYCIALSDRIVYQMPHLLRYVMAHEFAHVLFDDLRIKRGVMIGNALVLSMSFFAVIWSFFTLSWVVGGDIAIWEFILRQCVFLLFCGVLIGLRFRINAWLSEVMHAGEYAADAVGAVMVGSRSRMAGALTEMDMAFRGIEGLRHFSDSHPSTSARARALYEI